MLKLTYTELGLHLERLAGALEDVVVMRVILALRTGQPLQVEPGRASFLLPVDLSELVHLEIALWQECNGSITIIPVDDEFVEVSLSGSWVAESREGHEGMFLTVMSDQAELFVYKLWQMSETYISSLA